MIRLFVLGSEIVAKQLPKPLFGRAHKYHEIFNKK
jgi:hypothetical protein